MRLRDFCHIMTLLSLGAFVFHKHMPSWIDVVHLSGINILLTLAFKFWNMLCKPV